MPASYYDTNMELAYSFERQKYLQMPRQELRGYQLARLQKLLTDVVPHNRFYAEKFARVECLPLESLDQLEAARVRLNDIRARKPDVEGTR